MIERALQIEGKRVAVAGLGVAGFAACDALIEMGAQVAVFDAGDSAKAREYGQVLEILGAKVFLNYQNQLSNANTIQSTLNQNELAKLQALSQLSGYDYTDFLNRSIT